MDDRKATLLQQIGGHIRVAKEKNLPFGTLVPGLNLSYYTKPERVPNCFYHLSIGLIVNGDKRVIVGSRPYAYGTGTMLVTSVEIPSSYELFNVTPENPFISLSLKLNPALLSEILMEEGPFDAEPTEDTVEANNIFTVAPSEVKLLEAFERLLRLLDQPRALRARGPLIVRDIHYLVLSGTCGRCLRELYARGTAGHGVRRAIMRLKESFREALHIADLASVAGMAPTTFHRHFKAVTSITPLQYQKRLRRYEAQKLLLSHEADANTAAFALGYVSAQQFSREYKRLFGESPIRSVRSWETKTAKEAHVQS